MRPPLFDETHAPVAAGYLSPCEEGASLDLAPGQSLDLCASAQYQGSGSQLQVWFDFDDSTASKPAAPGAAQLAERAARACVRAWTSAPPGSRARLHAILLGIHPGDPLG